jgi:C_GCAxxG_C_C family probable redox protein
MPEFFDIGKRLEEVNARDWNVSDIEERFTRLVQNGTDGKTIEPEKIKSDRDALIERVRRRAEEYCYLTRNCAKGSATALFEEFGLGNMEMIRGLAAFPGIGMSGGICGPVAGGLLAIGLYFSSPDIMNHDTPAAYIQSRVFLDRFAAALGSLYCPDIQKRLLGKYHDPMASAENMKEYFASSARNNCTVAPGIGAAIAAGIIIDSMEG